MPQREARTRQRSSSDNVVVGCSEADLLWRTQLRELQGVGCEGAPSRQLLGACCSIGCIVGLGC
jgi:hypothetical protein